MGVTKIEWTATTRADGTVVPGYSYNPWRGCSKVSEGCAHCYAESLSLRNPSVLGVWGDKGKRVIASENMWREPLKWNAAAEKVGERRRVFCASMADVFEDRPELEAPRRRLARLIGETPCLDWLLLTKRPENAKEMINRMWFADAEWPKNYWLGVSVEDQASLIRRISILDPIPAPVKFLSCEPLLSALNFTDGPLDPYSTMGEWSMLDGVDWVIVGGESGPKARPCNIEWIRSIVRQCQANRVPCFVKQLGSHVIGSEDELMRRIGERLPGLQLAPHVRWKLLDDKGGDHSEWPEDLNVREFPDSSSR